MHGPAGPLPGARNRRALQGRAARAHRGAQAQARPPLRLLRENFWRSHSGDRRPPRGGMSGRTKSAASSLPRPADVPAFSSGSRSAGRGERRLRGQHALTLHSGNVYSQVSRDHAAEVGQERRPGVPRAPATCVRAPGVRAPEVRRSRDLATFAALGAGRGRIALLRWGDTA